MAKIVLQQNGKSFTIITNKLSRFWLPCLGEDGRLYCLFENVYTWGDTPRNDMDFLDEEQHLCIKSLYEVQYHKEPKESQQITNWDKEIFDKVEEMHEYIEEWKKKHSREWK